MSQPLQNMYALSGEHVPKVEKQATGVKQDSELLNWLLIPAFNRGLKALGFFISNKSSTRSDSKMHFVRFFRDDDTGEVLYITEIPESGCVEVMHQALDGPTRRRAAYLRFDTAQFHHAFVSPKSTCDGGDSITSLMYALQTSCLISEMCACTRCDAKAGGKCTCALALQRAEHLLGFRFNQCNFRYMFGTFEGRMSLSSYVDGQERLCQTYPVRNATQCTSSTSTQTLVRAAITNRLAQLSANPAQYACPECSETAFNHEPEAKN